ncbi:MAG: 8-amino-7-oxononanoate synthase [Planctomycetaceae bacterium]|nr:8-amino-7-oxononanoate synthase [Planctomycetaceae bacterium]
MSNDSPFRWIDSALDELRQKELLREQRTCIPLPQGKCQLVDEHGVASGPLWNFATNDYLGLAGHPRVVAAAEAATREFGAGARSSPLVTGRTPIHARLERQIATFKQTEAALLFPTGFAANVGTITSLVGTGDVVLCDRLNHASLIDGCRLSKATLRVYPHGDVDVVRRELPKVPEGRRKLIVTDSLFSMDGDAAPLRELISAAEEFGAMLLVDEAHATGVFGKRGTGLLENCSHSEHVIAVGTLSKALGAQGGFVAGSRKVVDWVFNNARPQIFSTALTPAACAAASTAIRCVEEFPEMREELLNRSQHLATSLRQQGWNVPVEVCGPIVPLIVGESTRAVEYAARLRDMGCIVPAIRPPSVPHNTARLRISLSYAHGEEGVDALIAALSKLPTEEK